ncbi:MAG: DUF2190 family protein [Phycisphaerales bacterium]|nr:DUF2190 family protein [Phycisphaerales bacterium]
MAQARLITSSNGLATLPHTPGSALSAGDIVSLGSGLVGVAIADIAANTLGAVWIEGEFEIAKPSGALTVGQPMFWDSAAAQIQNDYDGGVNVPFGWLTRAAATGDATAYVKLASKELAGSIQTAELPIANPAAGADTAATLMVGLGGPGAKEIISADLLVGGAVTGVDASNTLVVAIADYAGNSIVSKTYGATPPTADGLNNLGALSATHKLLTSGEGITAAFTQGATADMPACHVIVSFVRKG